MVTSVAVLKKLNGELEELERQKKEVRAKQLKAIKSSLVKCSYANCGKTSKLSGWIFIQRHWYISPHGCMGGDYWKKSKTEVCNFVCPKCGGEHYIFNHPQRDKIVDLVDNFSLSISEIFQEAREVKEKH